MKKVIILCVMVAMAFSGCSLKKSSSTTSEDMPPDKPWNNIVMETEKGYYYSLEDVIHSLRYTEKSNGADIFLCAKPECTHNGEETCTATYNFMPTSNYILYNGSIYFVADTTDKETYGFSLYKASLDGTSLDKIGDVKRRKFSEPPNGWGSLPNFTIHKGWVFITYNFGGSSYTDFIENGFVKMDIKTGKTETILSSDNFFESLSAGITCGCGDYLYYDVYAQNGDKNKSGTFRYNIKDGTSEKVSGQLGEILSDTSGHTGLSGITESALYTVYVQDTDYYITGYDTKTFEPNGVKIDLSGENIYYPKVIYYDNKIFICGNDVIKVYSDKGELIGQHDCPAYLGKDANAQYTFDPRLFDISEDKLYIGYKDDMTPGQLSSEYMKSDAHVSFHSCSIDDIIAGTGDWEKAYTKKHPGDCWGDEIPKPKYIEDIVNP